MRTVLSRAPKKYRGQARWICVCGCGTESVVESARLRAGVANSCGCAQAERMKASLGVDHPAWKGGKWKDHSGYVIVRPEGGTPRPEHVVIMEKFLGRRLLSKETVHHKNGIRDDNRLENLELWGSNHPSGQRISDLVVWAEELLKQYAPEKLK